MAERWLRVQLNLQRLRAALSREDNCEYTSGDIHEWLQSARFRRDDGAWVVREADLGQLEPSEVVAVDECSWEPTDPNSF